MNMPLFVRKVKEKEVNTIDYADTVQMRLDNVKSTYALGMMTKSEYIDLCRTINDGAMKAAEERLSELEAQCLKK